MAEQPEKQQRAHSETQLRWRFFWSRRSGARTVWALLCALVALLASIYLALPVSGQRQVVSAAQAVALSLGPGSLTVALEAILVVFACARFALLLAPGYRQYRYLTIPTSSVAPISVYVDAENILSEQTIPDVAAFLRKYLDGRRADLMFFMDAAEAARSTKYKMLFRYGFRPVDVPHNPTGKKEMGEAVDREIAMHAFERALIGPAEQTFVIITSDGDFAPLIYRLAALGHSVQVWSSTTTNVYRTLERYLPVNLVDLSQVIAEQRTASSSAEMAASAGRAKTAQRKHKRPMRSTTFEPSTSITLPASLTQPGVEKLYYALVETRMAHTWCADHYKSDAARSSQFRVMLTTRLLPRIVGVGYSSGSGIEYWLDQLIALGMFTSSPTSEFPTRGPTSAEVAARQLYAMAVAAAQAATQATSTRPDGLISMHAILAQLASAELASEDTAPLRALVAPSNGKRVTHTRYFVSAARALGLLQFEDVSGSLDLITNPQLTPPDEPGETSETDTAPQTDAETDHPAAN